MISNISKRKLLHNFLTAEGHTIFTCLVVIRRDVEVGFQDRGISPVALHSQLKSR